MKLMAMAGLFLGWRLTLTSLLFAVLAAGLICAVLLAARKLKQGDYLAFGPFLCAGIVTALWFGDLFWRAALPYAYA
jgi:leader peptidase (prepilin peptidase)/N-methyltransferase